MPSNQPWAAGLRAAPKEGYKAPILEKGLGRWGPFPPLLPDEKMENSGLAFRDCLPASAFSRKCFSKTHLTCEGGPA